ncbi:AP endonuclease 2 [Alternaria panax]|uniref:AP endonuclease 2 n=1 Tax=Alternaria panax TaxID=48097 RepID=A0AAD4I3U6_9PLEO|nr:AP endonuclease 2 [Alternaria panax]
MVRITTWNVNGIRNPFGYKPWSTNRTFNAMFDILETDIVIMQELKIQRKDLTDDMVLVPGWDCYFSLPKHKKGYSGVGIYTRQSVCAPLRAEEGVIGALCPPGSTTSYRNLPEFASIGGYLSPSQLAGLPPDLDADSLDSEGRCLVLEFPAFVLFGVYSPANSNGLRDGFRIGFLTALETRIRNLTKMGKNVILTGDLNVSRDLIDTARAQDNMLAEGMTHEEYLSSPNRRIFNQLLLNGVVPGQRDEGREGPVLYDLCREFHPDREGMFTHWEQKINARPGNFGSRIDFILCSIAIKDWFKEANIQEGLMGSDHCPVYAVTKDVVPISRGSTTEEAGVEGEAHILDLMNPVGMFKDGVRQREYDTVKDVPPLSGKLLAEFTKRRSIRDMFSKQPAPPRPALTPTPTAIDKESPTKADVASFSSTTVDDSDRDLELAIAASMADMSSAANGNPTASQSPLRLTEKRRASASTSPNKPVKRGKSNLPTTTPKTSKGQQSLKGFFQPRTKPADAEPPKDSAPPTSPSITDGTPSQSTTDMPPLQSPILSSSFDADPRASQEASKESWTKLFSKKPIPRCEHGEPCTSFTTKKPGERCQHLKGVREGWGPPYEGQAEPKMH